MQALFERTFNANALNSIVQPFDVPMGSTSEDEFFVPSIAWDGTKNKWVASANLIAFDQVKANQPYFVMPKGSHLDVHFSDSLTLQTAKASKVSEDGQWTFVGMYEFKNWAPGLKGNRMKSIDENLPEDIEVYINRGEDEGPLFVGTINTRTGEFRAATDRWFDLKGRKLNGKPTVKGTYYHNNKLEIIK